MKRQDLSTRLIDFTVLIYQVTNAFLNKTGNQHYTNQIIRSSSSSALNYGEALSAESKRDFIHKIRIALKELRETHFALQIIQKIQLCKSEPMMIQAIQENNELISIFVKTIQTAEKNLHNK
ncbi:MAG: four helix bundle protein [Bacteroidota bacterium]|nr:four helix bundle protein [Bacteroidota bacterium]